MKKVLLKYIFIALSILFIDQIIKFWIKLNFYLGEEVQIFSWFRINFVENSGMAFGIELGGNWGKLTLTIFRILASIGMGFYIYYIEKTKKYSNSILSLCLTLIFAGALGNIIDSIFYGVIFSDSYHNVASLFPEYGYAALFHGKVVDMLYFPIVQGFYPNWIPFLGGEYFEFFQPVFNIADTSISIGVILLLIFQKKIYLSQNKLQQHSKEN